MPAERLRHRRSAGFLALCAATAAAGPLAAATVVVTVGGVAPGGGAVLASLCSGGLDRDTCTRGQRQPAAAPTLTFVFDDVEPGRYAALAFQDSGGDGELRRSRMGRPLDPYGLSNGAGRLRRPTFEQAAVRVGGAGARLSIRLERPDTP